MNATFGARNRDPYFVQARTGAPSAFGLLLNLISYKVSVSMGSSLSQGQRKHVDDLLYLLKKSELSVSQKALYRLVREIALTYSFYPDRGSLKLSDWEKVGKVLHSKISLEVDILHAWHLCRHAIEMFGRKEEELSSPVTPPSDTLPEKEALTSDSKAEVSKSEVLPSASSDIVIPSAPSDTEIPSAPTDIEQKILKPLSEILKPPSEILKPPSASSVPSPSVSSDIEQKSSNIELKPPPSNIVLKSSFQKMVENCKADVAISGEELAELLSVCPVQYQPGPQAGQQIAEWEGLPFQILRELKKAISAYGIM
ncbi:endogenous retrovirus group K member 9 Gag polyprotein-like isoform X1 [Pantherophis guttatus]|uniref:Endogenous retrovirus group K member 9 Gag polyprotein-like isoform X1 n=1 Tax=Pantherophis guttatus TaxID=94885 RepID=A0A6P9D6P1_PANGU|nr:endogenous retrovirus group K member 9 Gag polyprotein-like isoform X1 [Pantherophis guttatus]